MITFMNIGKYGRLGNQIFQYAAMVSIARHLGERYVLSSSSIEPTMGAYFNDATKEYEFGHFEMFECFNIKCPLIDDHKLKLGIGANYSEPSFCYHDSFWDLSNNTNIHGYFQSEEYFINIRDELLKQLTFKDEIVQKAKDFISQIDAKTTAFIHVRRGDNVAHPDVHPLSCLDYISKTTSELKTQYPGIKFVVLTDDLTWSRKNIVGEEFVFSDNNHFVDLAIMTLCDHSIIANSSFSWWGAWLNDNEKQIVYAPKTWFGPRGPPKWDSVYCKDWRVI